MTNEQKYEYWLAHANYDLTTAGSMFDTAEMILKRMSGADDSGDRSGVIEKITEPHNA